MVSNRSVCNGISPAITHVHSLPVRLYYEPIQPFEWNCAIAAITWYYFGTLHVRRSYLEFSLFSCVCNSPSSVGAFEISENAIFDMNLSHQINGEYIRNKNGKKETRKMN